jgi:hypothetical protein
MESYQALFRSAEAQAASWRAEGSTVYLYSRTALAAINDEVPAARFVVCVRDPAAQLMSYHRTQLVVLNEDEQDLGRAWRRSLDGTGPSVTPIDPKLVDYPMVGRQGEALERCVDLVGRDRIHVIVFDDLVASPERVWRDLASFAQIDPSVEPEFRVRNASDKMYRSKALRRLTHRPPRLLAPAMTSLRQWSRTTDAPVVQKLKRLAWRAEPKPVTAAETSREIARYFAADVELMGKLLDRDLSHWTTKYD